MSEASTPSSLEFCAPCDWSGAMELLRRANEFLCANALSPGQAYAVSLVVEELVTNVVRHAHDSPQGHELCLTMDMAGDKVRVVSSDDGRPFDPTAVPRPKPPTSLEDAQPGGLGLALVRTMSESVSYERRGQRNVVQVLVGEPDWERMSREGAQ